MTNSDTVPGEGHTKGLSELLAKVQAASLPDRGIDVALEVAFPYDTKISHSHRPSSVRGKVTCRYNSGSSGTYLASRYTYSIDAALALVERVLPGWAAGFDAGVKTRLAFVDRHDHADRMFGARFTAEAPTIPLAILACTLKALIEAQP